MNLKYVLLVRESHLNDLHVICHLFQLCAIWKRQIFRDSEKISAYMEPAGKVGRLE